LNPPQAEPAEPFLSTFFPQAFQYPVDISIGTWLRHLMSGPSAFEANKYRLVRLRKIFSEPEVTRIRELAEDLDQKLLRAISSFKERHT
jgi:hypothetical protein